MPLLFKILLDVLAGKHSQERKKRSEEQKEEKRRGKEEGTSFTLQRKK